jgi:multifunctional cyclase/dehydratase/O-methyltransferase
MSKVVAQAVYALTELGVADELAAGPLTVAELARRTGAHPGALYRLLRCCAAFDVFHELPGRRFELTPMAQYLRAEFEPGVRNLVLMNGQSAFLRSYGEILHSARTGETAFDHVFGMPFFTYLEEGGGPAGAFHQAMTEINVRSAELLGKTVDLGSLARVADVGGGEGYFLAELLSRDDRLTGVLMDRPAAISRAEVLLAERGLAGRVELVPGDFFESVPAGCDAYVLKLVLHDWPDAAAVRILRTVRAAIGDRTGVRLFVIERLLGPANAPDVTKVLDIDMLVIFGGRERMLDDWRRLASAAGFRLGDPAVARDWAVLEFTAA